MLKHLHFGKPARVVIIGANGFVGRALSNKLKADSINVLDLTRTEVDLLANDAIQKLTAYLKPDDAVVFIAAKAPCKNTQMLEDNIRMMNGFCQALSKISTVSHLVYISSDAVYADSHEALTEYSPKAPSSLHGAMHLARELMIESIASKIPLAILRPSLIYGVNDPHNGYGPNRFRRLALNNEDITLFGEGEEQRDHVYIDDVAELIYLTVLNRSEGVLNIATGEVVSFKAIAEKIKSIYDKPHLKIKSTQRVGVIPHNGYRPFNTTVCQKAFPDFKFKSIDEGLKLCALEDVVC